MNEGDVVDALVSAYNKQSFTEMMRLRMGVNLEEIATGDNYREIVFKTVRHYAAISPAALWHMVVQAALGNPGNAQMAALVETLPQATQSPRWTVEGEAHRNMNRSIYGEVESDMVLQQLTRLETAIARWEEAAKWQAAAYDKRLTVIEKDIDANRQRNITLNSKMAAMREMNKAIEGQMMALSELVRANSDRVNTPRPVTLPFGYRVALIVLIIATAVIACVAVLGWATQGAFAA